jgi:hypothetical protein
MSSSANSIPRSSLSEAPTSTELTYLPKLGAESYFNSSVYSSTDDYLSDFSSRSLSLILFLSSMLIDSITSVIVALSLLPYSITILLALRYRSRVRSFLNVDEKSENLSETTKSLFLQQRIRCKHLKIIGYTNWIGVSDNRFSFFSSS